MSMEKEYIDKKQLGAVVGKGAGGNGILTQ